MENLSKIMITSEADRLLDKMLKQVNEDFPSGRVKKAQLASWIIKDFESRSFAKAIDKIREDHFDEVTHLKSVLRQIENAKKTDSDIELERLLSPLKGRAVKPRSKIQDDPDQKSDSNH